MVEASPLHVMLTVMRRKWRDGDEDGAVALAKAVAPYVHPKAAAARPSNDLAQVSDDDLDELIARGRAGVAGGCADEPD
jgi:hypothetical protein